MGKLPCMEGWCWDWADRIRKVRRVAGMSQAQMCRLCGVRATTWGAWESGRNTPKAGERRRVAEILSRELGVCPDWLTAPDQQFSPLLPRMDSNHQPPDWRSDAARKSWWRTAFHDPDPPECVLSHSLTGSCCTSHRKELSITNPVRPATTNCSACRGG